MFLYVQEVQGVIDMAFQLVDITYPKTLSLYNSERREQKGCLETSYSDGEHSTGHYYGVTYLEGMQKFIIDTTGTDYSHRKNVTLFTFANGVEMRGSYYVDNGTGWIAPYFVDKDGNNINFPGITISACLLPASTDNPYGESFEFYFNPSQLYYGGNPPNNSHPNNLRLGWFFTEKDNASPYPTPELNGWFQSNNLSIYYNGSYCCNLYNQELIDSFFNRIVNGGDGTPISPIMPSEDTSGTGGGDDSNPDYNPFTDPINFPDLPTFSALTTGLISAYNPSNSGLRILGEKLWSDFFIEEIKKINNDPMEAVISLHLLPFEVPAPTSAHCMVGNYDTGINMPVISQEFMYVEGGEFTVNERFASALDYSPYTKVYIHIPYVGIVPLDVDYIMKKHLHLKYQVDVLTGGAVAMLMCDNAILYNFPCNLAMTIPLTSSNHQALYRQVINASAQLGNMAVSAASPTTDKSGAPTAGAIASVGHGAISSLESALNTVASKHSDVQKSGIITGVQGALDSFETYLIFHRPIQSLASNFGHFKGFPCNVTYTLSSLSGYTEVEYAHLEGVTALDAEKNEIQALLQSGVIL